MYLIAIGWLYVALMMSAAEIAHPAGGVLSAALTFVFYGLAPVALLMYLLGGRFRRQARDRAEHAEAAAAEVIERRTLSDIAQADGSSHAAADSVVATKREIP